MKETQQEIYPDVIENLVVPEYVDVEWLKEQPETLYRLDSSKGRLYYRIDEDGEPIFYSSVTTFIQNSLPTSPQLVDWKASMGKKEAEEYSWLAAEAGTFYHIQCGELLVNAEYDLDMLRPKLEQYIQEKHLPYSFIERAEGLKKDILCFAQWMMDYNVKPVAIEIVLWDDEFKIAGALDIVAEIDVEVEKLGEEKFKSGPRKGQRKPIKVKERQLAIIDIKSGKKGFYESHEIQLIAYWKMWQKHFPDVPVSGVYNFSPKDFRTATPTYSFKDQTQSKHAQKLPYLVQIAQIEESSIDRKLTLCHGNINIKDGLYSNIETVDLSDAVRKRHSLNTTN